MNSGIYTITHRASGTVYVGSSSNLKKRWRSHRADLKENKHHCSHLQRAYNKFGLDAFQFHIVEYIEPVRSTLLAAEQIWLDKLPKLYNTCRTAGSCLGMKLTREQAKKISIALKGKPKSAEHNEANRQAQLKVPRNEENISRWAHNRLGTTQTEEHKAKKNAAQRATKAAKTPEQKRASYEKLARTKGSIVMINGVEYLSLRDAENQLGISAYMLKKQLS